MTSPAERPRVVQVPLYALLVGVAMTVLSPILAVVASVQIAERSAGRALQQSESKWCSVVTTLDDAYRETPPTTAAGRNVARGMADLRRELRCPE